MLLDIMSGGFWVSTNPCIGIGKMNSSGIKYFYTPDKENFEKDAAKVHLKTKRNPQSRMLLQIEGRSVDWKQFMVFKEMLT